jgi:lipid-A-disaccharide synthase
MAEFAKSIGIKVVYYISPQVWAWKKNRVYKLKRTVDRMMVILPFEKDFYRTYGMDVAFVGHPLLDAIEPKEQWLEKAPKHWTDGRRIVALLPGSRKQEIQKVLPIMLDAADGFEDYHFVLGMAPSLDESFYDTYIGDRKIEKVQDLTYPLLSCSHAALVTSGTATLETALFKVPEVVCYKGNTLSYWIARSLVNISFISLANLVVNREIVKELRQGELNTAQRRQNLQKLFDPAERERFERDYEELACELGGGGASGRAADEVLALLA